MVARRRSSTALGQLSPPASCYRCPASDLPSVFRVPAGNKAGIPSSARCDPWALCAPSGKIAVTIARGIDGLPIRLVEPLDLCAKRGDLKRIEDGCKASLCSTPCFKRLMHLGHHPCSRHSCGPLQLSISSASVSAVDRLRPRDRSSLGVETAAAAQVGRIDS